MVHEQGYKDIETFLKMYFESERAMKQQKKEKHTED